MGESDQKEATKVLEAIYSGRDPQTIYYCWGNYHAHIKDLQSYRQFPDLELFQEVEKKFNDWQSKQPMEKDITSKL